MKKNYWACMYWISESMHYWIYISITGLHEKKIIDKKDVYMACYWIQACTWRVTGKKNKFTKQPPKHKKLQNTHEHLSFSLEPSPLWSSVLSLSYYWVSQLLNPDLELFATITGLHRILNPSNVKKIWITRSLAY